MLIATMMSSSPDRPLLPSQASSMALIFRRNSLLAILCDKTGTVRARKTAIQRMQAYNRRNRNS